MYYFYFNFPSMQNYKNFSFSKKSFRKPLVKVVVFFTFAYTFKHIYYMDKYNRLYKISLGTNFLRPYHLTKAQLCLHDFYPTVLFGEVVETAALNMKTNQTPYLNQVATFYSEEDYNEVKQHLKAIEKLCGRCPEDKRKEIIKIDLDILE